jgi:hypothetical protein
LTTRTHGVGAGVVREALTRLAEQTLLVAEPNRGYRVRTIDDDQVRELVELRRVTECAALRLSVERGDLGWEERVLGAHRALVDVHDSTDIDEMWAHRTSTRAGGRLRTQAVDLCSASSRSRSSTAAGLPPSNGPAGARPAGEHLRCATRRSPATDRLVELHECTCAARGPRSFAAERRRRAAPGGRARLIGDRRHGLISKPVG